MAPLDPIFGRLLFVEKKGSDPKIIFKCFIYTSTWTIEKIKQFSFTRVF